MKIKMAIEERGCFHNCISWGAVKKKCGVLVRTYGIGIL